MNSPNQNTSAVIAALRSSIVCSVLSAEEPEYEAVRRVWNGMIDRRPLAIVRCLSTSDVVEALRFARANNLPVCVRGGGHSVSGKAVADDAMLIDMSLMKGIEVDVDNQTAVVQAGVKWGEFDAAAEKYGMATTGGVISSTGVAGLTLGGGIGWLMGKYGLSCDNLIAAEVVTAEGTVLTASATEDSELLWALRGGGGNFGIVTSFKFQLHPLSSVHGGILLYPRSKAVELLRRYRDVTASAPDELTAYAALMTGHGAALAAIAMCHCGGAEDAVRDVQQFQLAEAPIADMTGEKRYTEIQTMLDFSAPAGLNYYFKCPFVRELSDAAIDTIVEYSASAPTELTQVVLEHMHGAASRVGATETAFGLRRIHYSVNIMPAWDDPALAETCIAWARGFAEEMKKFGGSDSYVNYLSDEGGDAVRASYGVNYDRLAQLKAKYDPDNVFRFNQNIPPAK